MTPEEAKKLARNSALRMLATLNWFLDGDLDQIEQVIRIQGVVHSTPDFTGQGEVIDGCNEVLIEALGDRGKCVRICFGAAAMVGAVNIDYQVRLKSGAKTLPM